MSFQPSVPGKYSMRVRTERNMEIKGSPIQFTAKPMSKAWTFDPGTMQAGLALSNSNKTVTNTIGGRKWPSVYGTTALKEGIHKWKVILPTTLPLDGQWVGLGVSPKPFQDFGSSVYKGLIGFSSNGYEWNGNGGYVARSLSWQGGDVIQMELNCKSRTLAETNLRTGISFSVTVPNQDLYPQFIIFTKNHSLTLQVEEDADADVGQRPECRQN